MSTTDLPVVEARTIYERPDLLIDRSTHYCPGCGHGIVHRLIAEVLSELELGPRTIAVAPVGLRPISSIARAARCATPRPVASRRPTVPPVSTGLPVTISLTVLPWYME